MFTVYLSSIHAKARLDFEAHSCQGQQEAKSLVVCPTIWEITDINRTLDRLIEMMVGWILLCRNLGDVACLQKDIATRWVLVVDIDHFTVDAQLTWPGRILLESVNCGSKY